MNKYDEAFHETVLEAIERAKKRAVDLGARTAEVKVMSQHLRAQAVAKGKDPRGMPAREVSSRELVTVGPDHDLSDALQLMAQHQVRRLPVVDDENRLVGIVSQADLALEAKDKSVGEMLAEISKPPQGPRQL